MHSWGGVIEILHRRSVDLVADAHTLLRGKWSLFPGSNGRFYGALLRYASTLASTLVSDECLLIAGGSPEAQILKGLNYSVTRCSEYIRALTFRISPPSGGGKSTRVMWRV